MDSTLQNILARINQLQTEIDKLRPLSPEQEARIMQKFRLDWNYHSNHIEGNQLTYGETKTFLLHGLTAKGKPFKDHLDIRGHNEAILWLEEIIKQQRPLNETFICQLHEMILVESYQVDAITLEGLPTKRWISLGKYKQTPNHVKTKTGEIFYFATPEETPAKMYDLMNWYSQMIESQEIPSLLTASLLHYKFIRIHPFDDGNGRMARILMNLILMMKGFPPVIIKSENKEAYYQALQIADGGEEDAFVAYIGEQLIHSQELYLKGARGEEIEELDDVDKEIALLKKSLEGEQEKTILFEDTKDQIFLKFIKPFLYIIDEKLTQFDDLFFEKKYGFERINSDDFDFSFLDTQNFHYLKSLNDLETSIYKKMLFPNSTFKISVYWNSFKKAKDKLFDCEPIIRLIFFKEYFSINEKKIYYNNKNPNEEYQKIANVLAKNVLEQIKAHLKEEQNKPIE